MVECHQLVLAGPPETDAPDLSPEHLQPELKSKAHQYINWLLQVQLSAKSRSVFKDEGLPDKTKPSKVARAFWPRIYLPCSEKSGRNSSWLWSVHINSGCVLHLRLENFPPADRKNALVKETTPEIPSAYISLQQRLLERALDNEVVMYFAPNSVLKP